MLRLATLLTTAAGCILLPTLWILSASKPSGLASDISVRRVDTAVLQGNVIMPKLGNETAKAELGRAAWKVLHTMAQRYPKEPSADQREAYASYLHLFARLYPCGECASHFQSLLSKFPPQTSSRTTAAMHLCSLHNMVNERLGKEEYDCSKLEGDYDCGCAEEPVDNLTHGEFRRDPITGERLQGG